MPAPPRIYVLIPCCLFATFSLFAPPLEAQSPPPTPTNVVRSGLTHNSVTLSWESSPGATSYEVARETIPWDPFWRDIGDVTSYTFTDVGYIGTQFRSHFYRRAKNSAGTSSGVSVNVLSPDVPAPPGSGSRDDDDDDWAPPPTPIPIRDTLNHLPPSIQVSNWHDGAQGQQVDHVGVGRADVIPPDDIINAVNIWGDITPDIEVCFDQPGRLVFVDSIYPPIDPYSLPAYQRAGMTCATIDTAGTVVLLENSSQASQPYSQALIGCEARPWANVKFRQSPPGGAVISVTSSRKWLPASEKRYGYFKVALWGREGWISGDYVYTRGDCGA